MKTTTLRTLALTALLASCGGSTRSSSSYSTPYQSPTAVATPAATPAFPASEQAFRDRCQELYNASLTEPNRGYSQKWLEYLKEGMNRGYPWAFADTSTIMLETGRMDEAVQLLHSAAELGSADGMYMLFLLNDGLYGHAKDPEQARYWLVRAAQGGNAYAQQRCREQGVAY